MGFRKYLLTLFCIGFSFSISVAQKKFNSYLMPTVSVDYSLTERFSQEFEVESRNFIYKDEVADFVAKHLELSHVSSYQHKNRKFSFGVKYRFEADRNKENELRLLQQYEWKRHAEALFSHRLRAEERIYRSVTKFRLRYKTELNFKPKNFVDDIYLSNEFVVETNKIEYENRLSFETGWNFADKSSFLLGVQYRLSDFTHATSHNVFLTAGLEFKL